MPVSEFDPRVYFAAERTMLAWLRTGLTVMAFGFVIARFGLFLKIVSTQLPTAPSHAYSGLSALLGTALVAAGTLMILAATAQHRSFIGTLPTVDRPRSYSGGTLILFSSVFIAMVGIALTVYLAASAD
jgi:putative membrane protein